MAADSKIEWTDHTFNPWIGCTKVSTAATGGGGCDNCYAEMSTPARVLRSQGAETWGTAAPRIRTSAANWKMPLRWDAQHDAFFAQHGRRQRVFCASLADVFDNAVDPQWRADLFDFIYATPHLDWLLLTKRIGNVARMVVDRGMPGRLPSNVWLGATIVNQAEADRDIPKLLAVPARVHFLSLEPLLGPVNLSDISDGHADRTIPRKYWEEGFDTDDNPPAVGHNALTGERWQRFGDWRHFGQRIDWVIVGGESGPKARPMHPDWARNLRDQCQAAGVAFFFKQWGEWIEPDIDGMPVRLTAREGDPEFFDAAAKVDGFLCVDGRFEASVDDLEDDVRYLGMKRIGKKAAGRLLDGRTWDQFPKEGCHGAT